MSLHRKDRIQAFRYALRGIGEMLRTESNARIHALATIVVVSLGLAIRMERIEWLAIILAITAVWCAEAFNTAFEALCDVASPEFHPQVERAKDVAAGAVLITAIGAALVGVFVFAPHLIALAVLWESAGT
jgi:diacylglycerol kinase (ATP)